MSVDLLSDNKYDVYISYAKDEPLTHAWTCAFVANLEELGFRCWHRNLIEGGDEIDSACAKAMNNCKDVILIVSPGTPCSSDCTTDIDIAEKQRKRVRPILLWKTHFFEETLLKKRSSIDFTRYSRNENPSHYRHEIARLFWEIKSKQIDRHALESIDIPERCSSFIDGSLWMDALKVVEFCYQYANALEDVVNRFSNKKNLSHDTSDEWEQKAYENLYKQGAHDSIQNLDTTLQPFFDSLVSICSLIEKFQKLELTKSGIYKWWEETDKAIKKKLEVKKEEEEERRKKEDADTMNGRDGQEDEDNSPIITEMWENSASGVSWIPKEKDMEKTTAIEKEKVISPVFISYKRERLEEIKRIGEYFDLLGIPYWQDVKDLGHEQMETEIRGILSKGNVSGALMFLTPEIKDSPMIRDVEAPEIVKRKLKDDWFYCVPAIHQMNYNSVDDLGLSLRGVQLSNWNLLGISHDSSHCFTDGDARKIAERVFSERLAMCRRTVNEHTPLKIGINTCKDGFDDFLCYRLSLHHFFDGRHASDETWTLKLLPAFDFLSLKIRETNLPVEFRGKVTTTTALALGTRFRETSGHEATWCSTKAGRPEEVWSLNLGNEDPEINIIFLGGAVGETDLAVLISLTNDVSSEFGKVRNTLSLRQVIKVEVKEGANNGPNICAARGLSIAKEIIRTMRNVRSDYQATGTVHLFMAVPVSFSFIFGQLLNTFGKVVTYEYDANREPAYMQEVTLYPSNV